MSAIHLLHTFAYFIDHRLTYLPDDDQRQSPQSNRGQSSTNSASNGISNGISSDITAWQTALLNLPEEFRNSTLPLHPLPQLLAVQPTLRQIEWNQYRQYGGFVPRTPHDFSSLMIYVSGQVNPNPCRRCILKNGPFARCIVSPPSVLAQSSLKHACANCTYQNQYKKCTNEPITKEELVRSQASRSVIARPSNAPPAPPAPRKPKVTGAAATGAGVRKHQHNGKDGRRRRLPPPSPSQGYGHMVQKLPSAQSISADSFADKLRQVRSWSPRSRRRMKAEVMQWQAAMATVEAEKVRSTTNNTTAGPQQAPVAPKLPFPTATPSSMFLPPTASISGSAPEIIEDEMQLDDGEEFEDGDESDGDGGGEEHGYEGDGPSWVGFDDAGPLLKPPL